MTLRNGAVTHANLTIPVQNSENPSLCSLVEQIFWRNVFLLFFYLLLWGGGGGLLHFQLRVSKKSINFKKIIVFWVEIVLN